MSTFCGGYSRLQTDIRQNANPVISVQIRKTKILSRTTKRIIRRYTGQNYVVHIFKNTEGSHCSKWKWDGAIVGGTELIWNNKYVNLRCQQAKIPIYVPVPSGYKRKSKVLVCISLVKIRSGVGWVGVPWRRDNVHQSVVLDLDLLLAQCHNHGDESAALSRQQNIATRDARVPNLASTLTLWSPRPHATMAVEVSPDKS